MFTKISVLIPTRQRVHRLEKMLDSYEKTRGVEHLSELVFRVDEDDVPTQSFLITYGQHIVVIGPRHKGYTSMPQFFNEMYALSNGDVLLCGNDDMVFHTKDWPEKVLMEANKYPDGLFDFGVTTHNETHFPFSIVSRKAAERMGFLWDPRIFWGDIFLRDVMATFNRAVMLPHIHIEHDWAGNKPDVVFNESIKDVSLIDPVYWSNTHPLAVSQAVKRLQEN